MLSRDKLPTAEAVLGLGLVIARTLQEGKPITIFFNKDGNAELAPYDEVLLDVDEEEIAVSVLFERGYADEQVLTYLVGRRARKETLGEVLR